MNRYNNILLKWDMGDEIRAICFIREHLTRQEQNRVSMIEGHGGIVVIYWKRNIPQQWLYMEGKSIKVKEYDGFWDSWVVNNVSFDIKKPSRYISKTTRYEVLKRQKFRCNSCGEHLKYSKKHEYGNDVAHMDHIHPFSKWESYNGDINEISNIQALCSKCNSKKYNRRD
jgi:hypothetical protein